jgi:short-subunit dehydrogenase involved in D-alanine esterification of teichoic acids
VKKITSEHPDLDCIINNAGVQKPLSVTKMSPEEFLSKAEQEIAINIRGPMHLAMHLLPHFRQKESAVIMNVSSALGFIPISIINPVYNATKAWLHFFSMNLRTQLKGTAVKVVEVVPPMVATDLHRDREDPDDNKKEKSPYTLTLDEFMSYVVKGWENGADTVGAGMSEGLIDQWSKTFGGFYEKSANSFRP